MACILVDSHTAGIGIIRSAGRNGKAADLGDANLVLRRGERGLGGSNCTGEDEDDDEGADDVFHKWDTPKVVFSKKDLCGQSQ